MQHKQVAMIGKLFVVGIGPGDPELLTLKAVRILNNVSCVFVPKGRDEGSSLALSIAQKVVDFKGKEIVEAHFPMVKTKIGNCASQSGKISANDMDVDINAQHHSARLEDKWDNIAQEILLRINKGIDIAFLTLGDPMIYSTFFYLYDRLISVVPDLSVQFVPGISSINASSASTKLYLGLGDDKIAIIPANYISNLKSVLIDFNTIVLMKVNKSFDVVVNILTQLGLINNAVYIVRASMQDEKVFTDITKVKESDLDYFSMVIVRK